MGFQALARPDVIQFRGPLPTALTPQPPASPGPPEPPGPTLPPFRARPALTIHPHSSFLAQHLSNCDRHTNHWGIC